MNAFLENHLHSIKKQLQHYLNYTFKDSNIKSSEILFLRVLKKIGKTSQICLAKHLECDKSHVHRITNKLLEKGFISFSDNNATKIRKNIIEITHLGNQIIDKVDSAMNNWFAQLKKGISEEELYVFKTVVQKITQNSINFNLEKKNDKDI